MLVKNNILGIEITNDTEVNILEYVIKNIEKNTKKYYIVTPNPEIIVYAHHNSSFKNILNNADLALCDGMGVALAGRILNKPFVERITGVDFMISLCKLSNEKPITVGFLGGGAGVAEKAAECLKYQYPGLQVVFAEAGNPDEKTVKLVKIKIEEFHKNKRGKVNAIGQVDVLFVAFGFPKQEEWIYKYLNDLPVRFAMAVGGSFDYISGEVPRAPGWMRSLGLEWLFRLLLQPWRLKRQLSLLEFLFLVIKEKV